MTTWAGATLAEIDLDGLFNIDITFGKLQLVLKTVLTRLDEQTEKVVALQRQSDEAPSHSNGDPERLGHLEKMLKQLQDQFTGIPERVAALEARPSEFDDGILDDYMANHERRLQHLEQDIITMLDENGNASDESKTDPANQPKESRTRAGQSFQMKRGLPPSTSSNRAAGAEGNQKSPPHSPTRPSSPTTKGPDPRGKKHIGDEGQAGIYEQIGSPPVSARTDKIHTGLSDRLRSLMDDHEARLKLLEHALKNPKQPASGQASQPAREKDLHDLQQQITKLKENFQELASQPSESILPHSKGDDSSRLIAEISRRLGNLEKQLRDLESQSGEQLRTLGSRVQDAGQSCDKLHSDFERLLQQYREDNAAEAARRTANDLKLLGIRVGVIEDLTNRAMAAASYPEEEERGEEGPHPQTPPQPTIDELVVNVRLKALQDGLDLVTGNNNETSNLIRTLQQRVDDVTVMTSRNSGRLDELDKELRKTGATRDALDALSKGHVELKDVVTSLDTRLKREGQNVALLNSKLTGMATTKPDREPKANKSTEGKVDDTEIKQLKESLTGLLEVVGEHAQQLSQLDANKIDRHDLNGVMDRLDLMSDRQKQLADKVDAASKATRTVPSTGANVGTPTLAGIDVASELGNIKVLLGTHGSMIDNLFADKANRDTVVRQGQEIQDLKKMIETRAKLGGRGSIAPTKEAKGAAGGKVVDADMYADLADMLAQHDSKISSLKDTKADIGLLDTRFRPLIDMLDALQLNKADAGVVAGKAERDYVENALEKLRREVEQVMNNTNSGLIDTLDKSLNILRDMIDGKANSADMMKLQEMLLSETRKDETPEGLAGYKQYRCLSCNRKMDGMRPRPMGMNFMNFMSHLPNPRNKHYNTKRIGANNLLTAPTNPPVRALPSSAPSAPRIESHGDFLPPLDQGPHVAKALDLYPSESAESTGIAASTEYSQ
eukprot:TRINITY_DN80240_c0_g1_i1.p1 TRINITY_DN80240_c0_g1~~TRINITY_DN80240_c0_g1_i1.p1  ORF type:complete len:953 (-),score=172.76 TRINITY_DN80240_c0_g1_i1:91-2949(-)